MPDVFDQYNELTADEIVRQLDHLTPEELATVRDRETSTHNRVTVLDAIARKQRHAADAEATSGDPYPAPPAGRPPIWEVAEAAATPPNPDQEA